jgi:hypothetical protein
MMVASNIFSPSASQNLTPSPSPLEERGVIVVSSPLIRGIEGDFSRFSKYTFVPTLSFFPG